MLPQRFLSSNARLYIFNCTITVLLRCTQCSVPRYCVGCKEHYSLLGLVVEILTFFIVQQLVAFQLLLQLRSVPR